MGQLRTANKRHNRAIALQVATKAARTAETAPVAKPKPAKTAA